MKTNHLKTITLDIFHQQDMRQWILRSLSVLLILVLHLFTYQLITYGNEPLRWAVISSPDHISKSLGDLLLAELSHDKDFHFVDRDNVQKAVNELEINALFGNDAFETRLQLGQILKADRLIVLTETNQIYILDTKYGLSLFNSSIDPREDAIEKTCEDIATIVRSVKKRFDNGIQTIVAVSYFVSKSFDRSYDHLQFDLPNLLNRTLLQHDGVAVVAFDEIDKIFREYALTGNGSIKDRPVTIKVNGEISAAMKSPQDSSTAEQLFSLKIELRDNDRILETVKRGNLRFNELGPFISADVVENLLKRTTQNSAKLSLEWQKTLFLNDAVALDAVGANDLALNMRQAAFLLDPDDLDNTVNILLGPCLAQKWTGFTPSPIKSRYQALPFLEHALKSKNLKLMHGLQLIHVVTLTTEHPVTFDVNGNVNPPLQPEDDPLNIGDDLLFFHRLFPLLMQLPTDTSKDGPSRTRTDWNGISVQVYHYGPAEQYRTVSHYLDRVFYNSEFDWDYRQFPVGHIASILKPHLNKNAFRMMFEMRRSLPKETMLWSPGFLFYLPATRPNDPSIQAFSQETLLQAIPRDLWMYYCDLWRSTKDEDYILLADLYELYWLAFNSNKNDNGDWKRHGIAKIRKIFEDRWSETEPGKFVPKEQELSTYLMYLRSLEIFKGLADVKLDYNEPGTNLVYTLNVSSEAMDSLNVIKKTFSDNVTLYLRLNVRYAGGEYFHLKNDYFQFRPIPDWDVSLNKSFLQQNKWLLPFKPAIAKDIEINGAKAKFRENVSNLSLPGFSIMTRNSENADWRIEKYDESTDILWTNGTMYRLSRKEDGKIDYHLLETREEKNGIAVPKYFRTVKSDGKYIWSVNGPVSYGQAGVEMALRLSDRDGRILCTFDKSDGIQASQTSKNSTERMKAMPHVKNGDPKDSFEFRYRSYDSPDRNDWLEDERTDGAVSVCPLVPGKAIVVGRQGPLLQTWIGVATYDESTGEKNFKVVYGATRNITKDDLETIDTPAQMDANFSYPWLCPFRDSKHPERNQVLVGRRFGNYDNSLYATPLLVDLDERKVMLLTDRYPDLGELKGAVSIQCLNDVFVLRRGYKTIEIYHRDNGGRYVRQEIACTFPRNSLAHMDLYLFAFKDAVFAPGPTWYRIDVNDSNAPKCEIIGTMDCTIPQYDKLYRYAPSALFNVWALPRSGDPYMFDPTPVDKDFLPFEPFVPKDKLAKHDAAVKRLRELGCNIGHSSYSARVFFQNGEYCDGMFAVFTTTKSYGNRWEGTSADIALLKDVYDLRSVGFVNVELGPEEVKMIAEIPNISELALFESGVSDTEFAMLPLENYSHLVVSEYQMPARLTDKSLERLRGLTNIKHLNFSGMGFTDAAYGILKSSSHPRQVNCPFGAMSEEIRSNINQERKFSKND